MRRIVSIGGGNGHRKLAQSLLPYIQRREILYTAIVAMTDSGATTLRCRKQGFPGVGDARRLFMDLSPFDLSHWEQLDGEGWKIGNRYICDTIARYHGDVALAFTVLNRELKTVGRILPVTTTATDLRFVVTQGPPLVGEKVVPEQTYNNPIQSVSLDVPAMATPEAISALYEADLVILGPGSTWTSVIAALLPGGIANALAYLPGQVLYGCNISTERGEATVDVAGHIALVNRYARPRDFEGTVIDHTLVNANVMHTAEDLQQLGAINHITTNLPVIAGTRIVLADLVDQANPLAHDPIKLGEALRPFLLGEVQ